MSCVNSGSSWCSGRERELETGGEKGSPFSTTNSATYRGHQERVGRAEICTKHSSHLSSITHGLCVCALLERETECVFVCVYNNTYKEREIESVCMYVCVRDRLKIVERDRECVYVCVRWR